MQILMLICFHINASVTEESNKSAFLLFVFFLFLSLFYFFIYLLTFGAVWHILQMLKTSAANTPARFLGPPHFVTAKTLGLFHYG